MNNADSKQATYLIVSEQRYRQMRTLANVLRDSGRLKPTALKLVNRHLDTPTTAQRLHRFGLSNAHEYEIMEQLSLAALGLEFVANL